jgi:hypothetical protein
MTTTDPRFEEFTEDGYRRLLEAAAGRYAFETYGTASDAPHVLWRHDVDMSIHRARWMAGLEASMGLRATYFVLPHSRFYNLAEQAVWRLVAEIRDLGHAVGLHFDAGFDACLRIDRDIEADLAHERHSLEHMLGQPVTAFSFHDPSAENLSRLVQPTIAGMVNTYSRELRERYVYCSDSNGYWRHRSAFDVVAEAPRFLQMLTHPEWWTPVASSPRERVQRCIDGRARAVADAYDSSMQEHGRVNLGVHL